MSQDGLEPYTTATPPAADRRRRVVVAAAVAALAAGIGGGFAAGWASRGSPAPSTSIAARSAGAGGSSAPVVAAGAGISATTALHPVSGQGFSQAVIGTSSGVYMPVGGAPNAIPLSRRTTPDGISVRAYLYKYPIPAGASTTGCAPSETVTVELSDTEAVFETTIPIFANPAQAPLVVRSGLWGLAEGAPAGWAVITSPSKVDQVSAAFDSGTTDKVAPVGGIAVVASRLKSLPSGGLTGTVTAAGGGTATSLPFGTNAGPLESPACQPTVTPTVPPLPAAGVQPGDRTAAADGVTKAIGALFGGLPAAADQFQYVQGADAAVRAAQKTASDNNPNAHVGDKVDQIVFTSPTTGAVRYEILLDGKPVVSNEISQMVLDAGVWKVTRASACAIYAMGGGHC